MPTAEKSQTIEQAKEWYSKASGVVFTDYRGLTVKELQQLRRDLAKKGGEIHIIKNTLFRIAAGEDIAQMPEELHNGPTAVAFVYGSESECAKALFDFANASKKLAVKGGYFSGKAMTAKQMEQLSKLPSRDVLIAQVIGAISAPLSNLVGVIEALYADPIRVIGAVADKVGGGAPAPVQEEPVKEEPAVADAPAAEAAAEAPVAEAAPEAPAEEAAPEGSPEPTDVPAETEAEAPAAEAPTEVAAEEPAPSEDTPAEGGE